MTGDGAESVQQTASEICTAISTIILYIICFGYLINLLPCWTQRFFVSLASWTWMDALIEKSLYFIWLAGLIYSHACERARRAHYNQLYKLKKENYILKLMWAGLM